MNNIYAKLVQTILVGIGGTLFMDLYGQIMNAFGIKGLKMEYLGRWVLTLSQKKWFHEAIAKSPEMPNELVVGWIVHYMIGISFAFLVVSIFGFEWLEKPSLGTALFVGLITLLGPLMILQPALGLGYFASKATNPTVSVLRSIGSHTFYGIGLYVSAWGMLKFSH